MKHNKRHKLTKNVTLFAGATVTAMLAAQAHADVASDALINKLEQKGILNAQEAGQLRAESEQDFTNQLNQAISSKIGMPSWVTGYKLSGDFRGRYDYIGSDNTIDKGRLRYRLRAGLVINMNDNLQVGFRLGSGDYASSYGGTPLSNNSTLQDNFSKKTVYIDAAYGSWTPINTADWLLSATIGKMDNPFHFTPMVFDPDLTPEGGALHGHYTINDRNNITFAGAAFVLDAVDNSTHDPFLYGGQVMWNSKWNNKLASAVGVGGFQIVSPEQLTANNVKNYNSGNTLAASGAPLYNFNPVIADASVTYTLDHCLLYPGKFPITLAGEFINNPGAPNNNSGYWAGVTFGKAGKKHTWDLSYRYEYLEADAWYAQIVDDDNAAFFATGIAGGTNIKGHLFKADYNLTDALSLGFTCYINDLINNNAAPAANSGTVHAMADIMWKF
jgi:hypothetical protein